MGVKLGQKFNKRIEVLPTMSASALGSGDMEVFATPAMVALMENVAMECVASELEDGDTTVGIAIETTHIKATAIGKCVEAMAEVVAIDGRKISFAIEAWDEGGFIGVAKHDRFIVNKEKFLSKL